MNRKQILSNFRLLAFGLMDSNRQYLVNPKGELGELGLSNERIKLLTDTLKLLMETDIISDVTRTFMCGRWTNKTLAQYYNDNGFRMTVTQVSSRIYYDCSKYSEVLGESFIYDLCYRTLINLDGYKDRLILAYQKFNKEARIDEHLAIKLDYGDGVSSTLSQNDFDKMLEILYRCSKTYMDRLKDKLTPEQLAYLSYITTYTGIDKEDAQRLQVLKNKLKIAD